MIRVSIAVVVALLLPAAARAQSEDDDDESSAKAAPPDDEEPPGEKKKAQAEDDEPEPGAAASVSVSSGALLESGAPKARMTLLGGKFMFSAIVETNLAKSKAGKPISIAPDLWIGLADRLTVGIYHSGRAATGLLSGFGTGLCFRDGMSNLCKVGLGDKYTFVGSEARIGLTEGGFASALVLGGNARFVEDDKLFAGKAGFLTRINTKRIAVELSPTAFIGLNKRKVMGEAFNKDIVFVPLTIFLRFAPRVAFAVQGGATFEAKKPGDTYKISAAAGLSVWLTPHFAFDAAFGLAAVKDKDEMTKAFDQRSATVGLSYAL
jgi:hypothetical protein